MSSILTNSSALTALQSLEQTQAALADTQRQVSTGLKVSQASDNAAYWSIATQLNADNGVIGASNDALAESQSVLNTANSAIQSVVATVNSIQSTLTQATNPGADITNLNVTLQSLGKQLTDAVAGASFNGLNLLDGSQTSLNFVAGFTASPTGGTFNAIAFSAQTLTGGGGVTTTTQQPNITDTTKIGQLLALTTNSATLAVGTDVITAGATATPNVISVQHKALDGTVTTTTYTGLDINGNPTSGATALTAYNATTAPTGVYQFAVSVKTTTPTGLLTQGGVDLTNIVTSASTAATQLTAVEQALASVTNYAAVIGSTQDRMKSASTLNSQVMTDYQNGQSALVDADMNVASTRLQALQTQQQLGVQSLSIANQSAQLILKLFQ
jgi:flagellin